MKDLIVLVADKDSKNGIEELITRYRSMNIREIIYDIYVHPLHDPGVFRYAANFLRQFSNQYSYALVFFDHEGSGQEGLSPSTMAERVQREIEANGWQNRVEVIVFDPELEIWIWVESPNTAETLGWENYSELKNWLVCQGFWIKNNPKPRRPKEALEESLKIKKIPRSSSIYKDIAQNVSLTRCQDESFKKFRDTLQNWFPAHQIERES